MKQSDLPAPLTVPFGAQAGAGYIRTIPLNSSDQNAASFALGFPPNTFLSTLLGGKPPDGRDVNGILNYITALLRGVCAGEVPTWSAAFSAAVGGYPLNAQVMQDGVPYLSLVDDNTATPGQDATRWRSVTEGLLSIAAAERTYQPIGNYATNPALATEKQRAEAAEAALLPLAGGTVTGTIIREAGGTLLEVQGVGTGRIVEQVFTATGQTPGINTESSVNFPVPFAEGTVPFLALTINREPGTNVSRGVSLGNVNGQNRPNVTNTGFSFQPWFAEGGNINTSGQPWTLQVRAIGVMDGG